jgi:hypothetical protein
MEYVTTLPHGSFGARDCCGCLNGIISGDDSRIECSECGVVLRRVPASEVTKVLHEMELALPILSALCRHCGSVNLFPGFEEIFEFNCREVWKVHRVFGLMLASKPCHNGCGPINRISSSLIS